MQHPKVKKRDENIKKWKEIQRETEEEKYKTNEEGN
jgi:hypothetical protein